MENAAAILNVEGGTFFLIFNPYPTNVENRVSS